MIKKGILGKSYAAQSFCTKEGAEVNGDQTGKSYLDLTDQAGKDTINVYIKNRRLTDDSRTVPDRVKEDLAKGVDTTPSETPELKDAELQKLKSRYNSRDWQASTSMEKVVHPADMSEKHWGIVMRTNSLLCGVHPREEVPKEVTLPNGKTVIVPSVTEPIPSRKAYYPAFAIKPRPIAAYDITFGGESTGDPIDDGDDGNDGNEETQFRIPRFHINDKTNIEIFETQNSQEKASADSGFTETAVSAGIGGIIGPVTGSASAGFRSTEKTATAHTDATDKKHLHVTYNYPRVKLQLDEGQLELSPECEEDIERLRKERTQAALDHFHQKYGKFFAPEIYLGGRLFSSEESDSVAGSTLSEKMTGFKAAANISLSGYGFQANTDVSHEKIEKHQDTEKKTSFTQTISWCADGGDTTLCNNPPQWCSTVASFYNWRVMQKSKLVSLIDHIGKLPGYADIPNLVRSILSIYPDKDHSLFVALDTICVDTKGESSNQA
ncbi:hypothetical protein ASPWEDRAFT_475600 [Aspergillus wentii DTO 134E9]|uniref:MACPF-like domain-containing protein n=1 Tax=Aspergillus wentii DTO 134E9 TaxID=1073089 RepID=A0A1L9RIN2_ASPWE|nr:uncharacterized protein ASPWEDRAFT_475600 [Aspergillus wentii DTO 134E9]OJJ34743.1 hypothetical protein ASPWEDRAFT_475600 [Aspergillus wentii DTO 134E9]